MLFQHSPPLIVKYVGEDKIIIMTKYRIIYSYVGSLAQYFHAILVEQNPLQLQYSPQRQQSLVVTQKSIQIYSCDYFNQAYLKRVIILNEQHVFSAFDSGLGDWDIFGQIYQYSSQNLKIYSIQQKSLEQQQPMGNCFVDQFQIYLTQNGREVIIYDHKRQTRWQVKWNQQTQQVEDYLKQLKQTKINIQGKKLYMTEKNRNLADYATIVRQSKSLLLSQNQEFLSAHHKQVKSTTWNNQMAKQLKNNSLHYKFLDDSSKQSRKYVLIVQINSKFIIVLTPPLHEFSPILQSYQVTNSHLTSSLYNDKKASNSINFTIRSKPSKKANGSMWQIKVVGLMGNSRLKNQSERSSDRSDILLTSIYHHKVLLVTQPYMTDFLQVDSPLFYSNKQLDKGGQNCQTKLFWVIHCLDQQNCFESNRKNTKFMENKTDKTLLFSLVKFTRSQFNQDPLSHIQLFLDQEITQSFYTEAYLISQEHFYNQLSDQIHQSNQKLSQFVHLLKQRHNRSRDQVLGKAKLVVELTKIQKLPQGKLNLTFLYYLTGNKAKTLSMIKVKALRIDQTQKVRQIVVSQHQSNKNGQQNQQNQQKGLYLDKPSNIYKTFSSKPQTNTNPINPPPVLSNNGLLATSQSITNSQHLTISQPISSTLNYSEFIQAIPELSRKFPSETQYYRSQKVINPKIPKTFLLKKVSLTSTIQLKLQASSSEQEQSPLKLMRSKQYSSNQNLPSYPSQEKSPTHNTQHASQNNRVGTFSIFQQTSPIHQLAQENCIQQKAQLQQQSVQEVIEIIDFNNQLDINRNNDNQTQRSQKNNTSEVSYKDDHVTVRQKSKDFNNENYSSANVITANFNGSVMNSSSLQGKNSMQLESSTPYEKSEQIQQEGYEYKRNIYTQKIIINQSYKKPNIPTPNNRKKQRQSCQQSALANSQQKQFYQKFINHYQHKRRSQSLQKDEHSSQFKLGQINDSRQSYAKLFRGSKASVQDNVRTDKMSKMIGGKDYSQIIQYKRAFINTEQQDQNSISQQQTVLLGKQMQIQDQSDNNDPFTIEQDPNDSYDSQPTVILLDKLQMGQSEDLHHKQGHFASDENFNPTTPGFNHDYEEDVNYSVALFDQPTVGIIDNDQWGNFTKKWSFKAQDSVVKSQFRKDSFAHSQPENGVVTQRQFEKLSRKVKSFCPDPLKLTWDQVRDIQAKKYTQLMRQIFLKFQQRFNTLMREFLPQIIREEQARLFFAEYIRTFSGKTRDILVRLYMSLPETEQNRKYMSRALSQFKLSQVPESCIPVAKQIMTIFKFIYPDVYVQDLLKPQISLYHKLLVNYFKLQKLPDDQLKIQDQSIDISHPRNLLNILLYLNQHYNLPMNQLFETYCTQLIRNNCVQIIVKMLREETFQICQVKKDILQEIVENVIVEKLKQCLTNIQWVSTALDILGWNISPNASRKKKQLTIVLNVIDSLNLCDLIFNIDTLFKLHYVKNLFVFCNSLIRQNSYSNLRKIKLQDLYKDLHEVAQGQKVKFYNQQLKDLLQILCQKYFQNGALNEAFQTIAPIIMTTKRGFIAKMLFKYLQGKLMNRLSNNPFKTKRQFTSTFGQFFPFLSLNGSQNTLQPSKIQHDFFQFSQLTSYLVNCSYLKYLLIFKNCVNSTSLQQVIYICYTDYQLGSQLSTYHVITKKEWQDLSQALKQFVPKEQIRKLVDKNTFKFNSTIRLGDEEDNQNYLIPSTSLIMKDSTLLNLQPNKANQNYHIKSLRAIKNPNLNRSQLKAKKNVYHRSKSDPKIFQQDNCQVYDPLIQNIKYEVNPQAVRQSLKQIYERREYSNTNKFLKALSLVDRQRIQIYHYEKFKTIINLQLNFKIEQLLPFEFFMTADHQKCFRVIYQSNLLKKLQIRNFWTIYTIMQILICKGNEVATLMIQKIIRENESGNLAPVVQKIIIGTKINQGNLKLLWQKAKLQGLNDVAERIKERMLQG